MTSFRNFALSLFTLVIATPAHTLNISGESATATVYHPWYIGRRTACGEIYLDTVVSAAHPYLPCGTKLLIQHRNRVVPVRINDRCACNTDLSTAAALALGVPTNGIGRVTIKRL